jgi:ferric-dicitrate binding protein FerR (iron transport regulator)
MSVEQQHRQTLTPEEQKRRRARSLAIALALGALALLFYVVTMAKLGPQSLNRGM